MDHENRNKARNPKLLRRPWNRRHFQALVSAIPQIQPLRSPNRAIFHYMRKLGSKVSCMIPNPSSINQLHQSFQLPFLPFESLPALDPAVLMSTPYSLPQQAPQLAHYVVVLFLSRKIMNQLISAQHTDPLVFDLSERSRPKMLKMTLKESLPRWHRCWE